MWLSPFESLVSTGAAMPDTSTWTDDLSPEQRVRNLAAILAEGGLDQLAATSGLHPEDRDELWPLFDDACRNAPAWFCQYHWDIAERFTHAAFTAHGVEIGRVGFRYPDGLKRKIDCNAVYRLMDHGLWWPLLEGKRLASVSGHADEFAARLIDPEFVRATGGGGVTWSIATRITCPDKTVAKREFWNRLREELFAAEWDLLLCSAGSLSAVICEAARQQGRKAIDVGQLDRVNRTWSVH